MNKLLEETTKSIWKEIGKDVIVKTVAIAVSELFRAKLYVWKEVELKKAKRDLDVAYREEDLAWRIERIKSKREAMGVNTEEQMTDDPLTSEHTTQDPALDTPGRDA